MRIINFDEHHSLVSQYMAELRDKDVQRDMMRFRANLHRVGQIMAYEISRELKYKKEGVATPLDTATCHILDEQVVIATIFRAGIPFHQGFLDMLDHAENAFVSAYRKYKDAENFDVFIEYLASPVIEGKTLILADPMLATGASMELSYRALLTKGTPSHIHLASVIASRAGVEHVAKTFPDEKTTLWVGAIDPVINNHSYIVPGLGDAGDLAYGIKE